MFQDEELPGHILCMSRRSLSDIRGRFGYDGHLNRDHKFNDGLNKGPRSPFH
jgi:hypothetical protein